MKRAATILCIFALTFALFSTFAPVAKAAETDIFTSGFETGDLSEWASGDLQVAGAYAFTGSYGARGITNNTFGTSTYVFQDETSPVVRSGAFFRFYIYFENLAMSDLNYTAVGRILCVNASGNEARIIRNGTNYYFRMYYGYDSYDGNAITSVPLANSTWYQVTLGWSMNATHYSTSQLWINSVLKDTQTVLDPDIDAVSQIQVGIWSTYPYGNTYDLRMWFDNCEYGVGEMGMIINGGFETNDGVITTAGWGTPEAPYAPSVYSAYAHSGFYSAAFYEYSANQTIAITAKDDIVSFGFWAYVPWTPSIGEDGCQLNFTDSTSAYLNVVQNVTGWVYYDLLPIFPDGKLLNNVIFNGGTANMWWLDDVALNATAMPPVLPIVATVGSSPEISATFNVDGATTLTTPRTVSLSTGTHQFQVVDNYKVSGISAYRFSHWLINGTTRFTFGALSIYLYGDTNITMVYTSASNLPIIPPILAPPDASTATFYFRSDTHEIRDVLGYQLWEQQSSTAHRDTIILAGSFNASYGIRVWVVGRNNMTTELTSGVPVAVVTRTVNGSGLQTGTWSCPEYIGVADAMQVCVYQRFGARSWNLRLIFITRQDLLYRFPAATWTVYYYTILAVGSTNSTLMYGTPAYSSRIALSYYRADPYEVMSYRLATQDFFGFIFTPWTYWLGSLFWFVMIMFLSGTLWLRYDSYEPIILLWFIFGGTGGIFSLLLPFTALGISWLFLAFAFAIVIWRIAR